MNRKIKPTTLTALEPDEKFTSGYLIVDACTCEFPNYGKCNWCKKKEYFKGEVTIE